MLLTQPYSEAILQPGQTPGSAAGGASPDGKPGAWLGRRARLPDPSPKRRSRLRESTPGAAAGGLPFWAGRKLRFRPGMAALSSGRSLRPRKRGFAAAPWLRESYGPWVRRTPDSSSYDARRRDSHRSARSRRLLVKRSSTLVSVLSDVLGGSEAVFPPGTSSRLARGGFTGHPLHA